MSFLSAWHAKFQDLPVMQLPPVKWTDQDADFHSDLTYMRAILDMIVAQARGGGHCGPWPDDLKYHFAWLESQVADV